MKQKKFNWVKQLFLYGLMGFVAFSCQKKDDTIQTYQVTIKLVYPGNYQPQAGVDVKLTNTITSVSFDSQTDANGAATFEVAAGTYMAMATESRTVDLQVVLFNGSSNIVVTDPWAGTPVELTLAESTTNQVVIKELYVGGCQKDDGSGTFQRDPYVILYNNSSEPATLNNVCLGMVYPFNSNGTNYDYTDGTNLLYASENWIPAGCGIWVFQQPVTIDAGKQIVIALENAVDNTQTYSQSINFSNPDYYCAYDIDVFPNVTYYPAPSPAIPTSHYLKAYFYGSGNAWAMSVTSPAFFIFETKGTTPATFANDGVFNYYQNNSSLALNNRKKVPVDWIIDGIEVFVYNNAANHKRLTANVDAGDVELANTYGFTLYRNVDKAATEAIPENAGKIVYGYSLGTKGITTSDGQVINGTTDPSGIDAEASIKNGARIIYQDTNNSTNDFHQRSKASLRN